MDNNIEKRLFIVGCPRSGTTLLQNQMIRHGRIESFPESHFFAVLFSKNKNIIRNILYLPPASIVGTLKEFLSSFEASSNLQTKWLQYYPINWLAHYFITHLDNYSMENDRNIWLEKTPRHLHFVDRIESIVKRVHFIHIIRKGIDVIASLYQVTRDYPDEWGGSRSIDRCVRRWTEDVALSLYYKDKANHHLLSYDTLVCYPETTLRELFRNIGLSYREASSQIDTAIVKRNELWKEEALEPIQKKRSSKFTKIFTKKEQDYIQERIESTITAIPEDLVIDW